MVSKVKNVALSKSCTHRLVNEYFCKIQTMHKLKTFLNCDFCMLRITISFYFSLLSTYWFKQKTLKFILNSFIWVFLKHQNFDWTHTVKGTIKCRKTVGVVQQLPMNRDFASMFWYPMFWFFVRKTTTMASKNTNKVKVIKQLI